MTFSYMTFLPKLLVRCFLVTPSFISAATLDTNNRLVYIINCINNIYAEPFFRIRTRYPKTERYNLGSTIEIAKLLAAKYEEKLSISVIIMKFPSDTKVSFYIKSLSTAPSLNINFIELNQEITSIEPGPLFVYKFIESHKAQVRDFLSGISSNLTGIVLDMFCTSMIDVCNECDVPSYVFFSSSAANLGLWFHLQSLRDDFGKYVADIKDSENGIIISTYRNLVPFGVLPGMVLVKDDTCDAFIDICKRFRETKVIIVNTFLDLESYAIHALSKDETIPPVYTVGPILGIKSSIESSETEKIVKWLDLQPEKSVVYLCFGSEGHFDEAQVKEIAYGLEGSGYRFLWSLRKPPGIGKSEGPSEYENLELEEVLPEGFLKRTDGVGMVIGWAPQATVLSHLAVGGFLSHCGWNSTLESVWFGVPMATWPHFAEQQMNAFKLVKELDLTVEVKMDYKKDFKNPNGTLLLRGDVIQDKIKKLMDPQNGIRGKVKEMKEKCRLSLEQGGSSTISLEDFINDVIKEGFP